MWLQSPCDETDDDVMPQRSEPPAAPESSNKPPNESTMPLTKPPGRLSSLSSLSNFSQGNVASATDAPAHRAVTLRASCLPSPTCTGIFTPSSSRCLGSFHPTHSSSLAVLQDDDGTFGITPRVAPRRDPTRHFSASWVPSGSSRLGQVPTEDPHQSKMQAPSGAPASS